MIPSLPLPLVVTPLAVFAFQQPDWDNGPGFPMYHIHGGTSDGSTVSAQTLRELGIAVPVSTC